RSKKAQEKSARVLILVEYALRLSDSVISSVASTSALRRTWKRIGSIEVRSWKLEVRGWRLVPTLQELSFRAVVARNLSGRREISATNSVATALRNDIFFFPNFVQEIV